MKLNCSFHLMGDVMLGRDFYETRGSWSVRSAKSSRFLQCLVCLRERVTYFTYSLLQHTVQFLQMVECYTDILQEEIRLVILVYCI
jgi:hypothetical protein